MPEVIDNQTATERPPERQRKPRSDRKPPEAKYSLRMSVKFTRAGRRALGDMAKAEGFASDSDYIRHVLTARGEAIANPRSVVHRKIVEAGRVPVASAHKF